MCQGNVHGGLQGFGTQAQSQMWFVFLVEFQQINLNWINSSVGLNRSCKKSELHFDQFWIWKNNDTLGPRVHQHRGPELWPSSRVVLVRIQNNTREVVNFFGVREWRGTWHENARTREADLQSVLSLWEEWKSVCLESVGKRYPRVTWIGLCLACILNPNSV
jgi:hypothetical protein